MVAEEVVAEETRALAPAPGRSSRGQASGSLAASCQGQSSRPILQERWERRAASPNREGAPRPGEHFPRLPAGARTLRGRGEGARAEAKAKAGQ